MTNGTRSDNGSALRILVVGAGIAGLGAARALRQRGFAADVVERNSAWSQCGTGIYLPGNTARALRALGLESAVIERAALIPHQRICDRRGNLLTDINVATMWRDVGQCNGAVYVASIEEVILDEWSRGSVVLIGDAAHATSPNMAQGGAMALEDGLVLAECLATTGGVTEALARFQARRRPRTQWVLAQTHRRDRTRNLTPALRNLVLRRWGRNIFHANYRPLLNLP